MRLRSSGLLLAFSMLSCGLFGEADDESSFGAPVVLARGQLSARGVAVDQGEVYWASEQGDEIRATTKTGGEGVRIVAHAHRGGPREVLLDADTVYWTETRGDCCSAGLIRAPKAGGDPVKLLEGSLYQVGHRMSLEAGRLYATMNTRAAGECAFSIAADGSSSPLFFSREEKTALGAIVSAGPFVFWVTSAGTRIVRVQKPDGPPFDFASAQAGVEDMVTDGSVLYWVTDGGGLLSLAVDRPGQPPVQLASGLAAPRRLVLEGEHLYFLQGGNGEIARIHKTGSAPEQIATVAGARGLTVDATGVFVTADSGDILKIPRRP